MGGVSTFIEKIKEEGQKGTITGASVIFGTDLPVEISDVISYEGKGCKEANKAPLFVRMYPEEVYFTIKLQDEYYNEEIYRANLRERELSLISPESKEKGEKEYELEKKLRESKFRKQGVEDYLFESDKDTESDLENNWKEVQKLGSLLRNCELSGSDVVYESKENVKVENNEVAYEAGNSEEVSKIPEEVIFEPKEIRFSTKKDGKETYFLNLETGEVRLEGLERVASKDDSCLGNLKRIFKESNYNQKPPTAAILTKDKIKSGFQSYKPCSHFL